MITDYQTLLARCGFEMAIEPLRQLFILQEIDDPLLQSEMAREVVAHTASALKTLTRPRTLH